MKLRNKKTGEIIDLSKGSITDVGQGTSIQLQALDRYNKPMWNYNSLAELNEVWEDYDEPKDFWFIDDEGYVKGESKEHEKHLDKMKSIGNYFETEEEAEKAVERLKAWKRLKDKGFKFLWWYSTSFGDQIDYYISEYDDETKQDLNLLFGDGEVEE